MSDRQLISDHCLLQWLKRIDGHDIPAMRRAALRSGYQDKDGELLEFMQAYYGIDVEGLRSDLVKAVGPAIQMGAKRVNFKGVSIPIKNGHVAITAYRRQRPRAKSFRKR